MFRKLLTLVLVVLFTAITPLSALAADCTPKITITKLKSADINLKDYQSGTINKIVKVVKQPATNTKNCKIYYSSKNGKVVVTKVKYCSPVIIKCLYQDPPRVEKPAPDDSKPGNTNPKNPPVTNTPEKPTTPPNSGNNNGSGGTSTPAPGEFNAMQQEMLSYINQARAEAGVKPLTLDKKLCDGAYLKSKDMAVNNYFSHTSPTYGSPFAMMSSLGISYRTAGENIAMNSSVKGAHDAFMNSSGHRANILNASYGKVGLGFYQEGRYLYVTQWFTN
jgi:uncharacterized YkwD family protein